MWAVIMLSYSKNLEGFKVKQGQSYCDNSSNTDPFIVLSCYKHTGCI